MSGRTDSRRRLLVLLALTIVGSLLLGLYDDEGRLHHAGITASFTMARRAELVEEVEEHGRTLPAAEGPVYREAVDRSGPAPGT